MGLRLWVRLLRKCFSWEMECVFSQRPLTWWNTMTTGERITFVAIETCADWRMIYYAALSRNATESRTWILTFFSNTGLIASTLRVDRTFWPTTWRSTNICWKARTWGDTIYISTLWIRSTWRRITRVSDFFLWSILWWSYNTEFFVFNGLMF